MLGFVWDYMDIVEGSGDLVSRLARGQDVVYFAHDMSSRLLGFLGILSKTH